MGAARLVSSHGAIERRRRVEEGDGLRLGHHRRAARPRRDAREAGAGEGERCRAGEGEHLLVVRLLGFWQFGAQKEKTRWPDLNLPVTSL